MKTCFRLQKISLERWTEHFSPWHGRTGWDQHSEQQNPAGCHPNFPQNASNARSWGCPVWVCLVSLATRTVVALKLPVWKCPRVQPMAHWRTRIRAEVMSSCMCWGNLPSPTSSTGGILGNSIFTGDVFSAGRRGYQPLECSTPLHCWGKDAGSRCLSGLVPVWAF